MKEIFKKVEERDIYEISNLGTLRRLKSKGGYKYLKGHKCEKGIAFCLRGGYKISELGHILVAKTFLGLKKSKHITVVHIDGDVHNNCVDNLKKISLRDKLDLKRFNDGCIGVQKRNDKFVSMIGFSGSSVHLGVYEKETDAKKIYEIARVNIENFYRQQREFLDKTQSTKISKNNTHVK